MLQESKKEAEKEDIRPVKRFIKKCSASFKFVNYCFPVPSGRNRSVMELLNVVGVWVVVAWFFIGLWLVAGATWGTLKKSDVSEMKRDLHRDE